MPFVIEPLSAVHDRDAFDCGEPALNEYLKRYARQNQERGVGRTFVAVPEGERRIVGFYTLSAGSVAFSDVPEPLRRRLPRYPMPIAHLGRLATCRSVPGRGLGEALLFDALRRTVQIAIGLGVVAVEVWAKTDRARGFYERYGFESLVDDRRHLYLPLATVEQVLGQ
ncbi:MAG TPA: GNAT family N-acetyltransferase [Longimicrobiales bacterium]|nr:GNAT family N-acetyltransferase [Longimicrobiales bacterium]